MHLRISRRKIRTHPLSKKPLKKRQALNAYRNFLDSDLHPELDMMLAHLVVSHAKRLLNSREHRIIEF